MNYHMALCYLWGNIQTFVSFINIADRSDYTDDCKYLILLIKILILNVFRKLNKNELITTDKVCVCSWYN